MKKFSDHILMPLLAVMLIVLCLQNMFQRRTIEAQRKLLRQQEAMIQALGAGKESASGLDFSRMRLLSAISVDETLNALLKQRRDGQRTTGRMLYTNIVQRYNSEVDSNSPWLSEDFNATNFAREARQ